MFCRYIDIKINIRIYHNIKLTFINCGKILYFNQLLLKVDLVSEAVLNNGELFCLTAFCLDSHNIITKSIYDRRVNYYATFFASTSVCRRH